MNNEKLTLKMWTEEEEGMLSELYSDIRNEDIAKKFNVTKSSITNKANRLKLKKSKEFKSRMIAKRNKMVGRDLSFDLLKEIASKFKTRGEFQKHDSSAYTTARTNGFLDEICQHMPIIGFSVPQLTLQNIMDQLLNTTSIYNTRQIIKPYEIDIFYPEFNLALEYHGKGWHIDNKNDKIKYEIFQQKNINIIYIIENNRRYEEDIKNQIIVQLPKINQICKALITADDVRNCAIGNIYEKLYNKEKLINIAKQYTTFREFVNLEKSVYEKLRKLKLLDVATEHMADRRIKHTTQMVVKTIQKYSTLKKLMENDWGTYQHIKRNNLSHLISHLKRRKN